MQLRLTCILCAHRSAPDPLGRFSIVARDGTDVRECVLNISIFEACRSPDVVKGDTEGRFLSRYFKSRGIDFVLYSNDGIWPDGVTIDREVIRRRMSNASTDIVHLAMHGFPSGLALQWSAQGHARERTVLDLLPAEEIAAMPEWQGKLIVSGACQSQHIAADFLKAGARGVVAPLESIPWDDLAAFFEVFYDALGSGADPGHSLGRAQHEHPKYRSFEHTPAAWVGS